MTEVETFVVPVRNDATGEVREVEIQSVYGPDAQIAALQHVFRLIGWRKATALLPNAHPEAG